MKLLNKREEEKAWKYFKKQKKEEIWKGTRFLLKWVLLSIPLIIYWTIKIIYLIIKETPRTIKEITIKWLKKVSEDESSLRAYIVINLGTIVGMLMIETSTRSFIIYGIISFSILTINSIGVWLYKNWEQAKEKVIKERIRKRKEVKRRKQ